jgi:hypothetical protein
VAAERDPSLVARLYRLTAVLLATLVTAAGQVAICGSWKPVPEARMACCNGASTCPMRGRDAGWHASHRVSQADADACCAVSDRHEAPPAAAFALPAPIATALAALPAFEPVVIEARRARADESPPPGPAVPRHILFSVLLV